MTDTSQTSFRENLTDAGCCEESIRLCESLRREGKTAELLKFLTEQRKRLLVQWENIGNEGLFWPSLPLVRSCF